MCDECTRLNSTLYAYGGKWLCDSCLRDFAMTTQLTYTNDPIIAEARAKAKAARAKAKARAARAKAKRQARKKED